MADRWPSTLPQQLLRRGFSATPRGPLRTPPSSGPVRTRPRSTLKLWTIRGVLILSADQRNTLDTFYWDTLKTGAKTFIWTSPFDNAVDVNMTLTAEPGFTALGTNYEVSLQLEMQP